MKNICVGLSVFVLLCVSLPVSADLPVLKLDEVIVVGSRAPEIFKNATSPVDLISRDEIIRRNFSTLAEILGSRSAYIITSQGSSGNLATVRLRGVDSNKVLVTLDGIPLNSVANGTVDLNQIPADIVERVEILKNSASNLYGENAVGGVINIVSKRPVEDFTTNYKFAYKSFNSQDYYLDQSYRIGDFKYLVSLNRKTSAGSRANNEFIQQNVLGKAEYALLDNLDFSLKVKNLSGKVGVPGPVPAAGLTPSFGNAQVTSLYDFQKDNNTDVDLSLNWGVAEALNVRFITYLGNQNMLYHYRGNGYNLDWTTFVQDSDSEYQTKVLGYGLQYNLGTKENLLSLGYEGFNNRLEVKDTNTKVADGTLSASAWNADANRYGWWLNSKLKLANLTLNLGGRYDKHSQYPSQISPKLALNVDLSALDQIQISAGRAFKAPTFNDLFWPGSGNPNLNPEISYNYDLAYKHYLSKSTFAQLSLFSKNIWDMIAWNPDSRGNWAPQNINTVSISGVEFELDFAPRPFFGNLSFTYLNAAQKNKELIDSASNATAEMQRALAHTPAYKAAFNLGIDTDVLSTTLSSRYVGSRSSYYAQYGAFPDTSVSYVEKQLPAYLVSDLAVQRRIWPDMSIEFGVDNIFNVEYFEQLGTSFADRNYPALSRTFKLGLSGAF